MTLFVDTPLPAQASSQVRLDVQCREGRWQVSRDRPEVNLTHYQELLKKARSF